MDKREEYATLRSDFDDQLPRACGNCGVSNGELHIHHIVPLSCGGNNVITNLVRLCNACHSKAHGGKRLVEVGVQSLINSVKSGGVRNGTAPYGYVISGKKYEIDENKAEVVRYIYRLRYYCEYSTPNIAVILNNMAISSPRGALWSHLTVRNILDNPIYSGETVYNGENYGCLYPAIIDAEMSERIERFNEKHANRRVAQRKVPQLY